MSSELISQKELKKFLRYDAETGLFTWIVNKGSRGKAGAVAGNVNSITGYILITINKKQALSHRLAFMYMTGRQPKGDIDHINGIRADNRWRNLRDVSFVENHRNRRMHKSNSSGVTGVRWLKNHRRWIAEIRCNYRLMHLGTFTDKFDAICCRKRAETMLGFHENHGASC